MSRSFVFVAILALACTIAVSAKDQVILDESAQENISMLSLKETRIEQLENPVPEGVVGMWKDGVEYVDNILGMEGKYEAQELAKPVDEQETVQSSELSEGASPTTFIQLSENIAIDEPSLIDTKNAIDAVAAVESQLQNQMLARAGGQQKFLADAIAGVAAKAEGKTVGHSFLSASQKATAAASTSFAPASSLSADKYKELALSANKYFDQYSRSKFEFNNVDGGMPILPSALEARKLEDCGGCLFVLGQVQMDCGASRLRKTVFDSIIANCRQAGSTPIFFLACQDILNNIDSIVIDYANGRNPVDVCTEHSVC